VEERVLGGIAEMANLGLPVPPGFTITTAVCTHYYENGNAYPKNLQEQVRAALAQVARITGKTFGDGDNPLLMSVRSGGRASMPGMMDTVLKRQSKRQSARANQWCQK
jgi:pyruvate,orthophosphate dikinase